MQHNSIDLLKLFFAFCIVLLHSGCLDFLSAKPSYYFTQIIVRLAVPFFFITSSFFLGIKVRKAQKQHEVFSSYRKHLLPPLLVWGTIGAVLYLADLYKSGISIRHLIKAMLQSVFCYPQGAMWFVLALIIGSILLEIFLKYSINKAAISIFSVLLYFFASLCNTYYFLAEGTVFQILADKYLSVFASARNGIFLFLYIWLGYLMSNDRLFIKIKSHRTCISFLFLLSMALVCTEAVFTFGKNTADDNSLFLSYPFAAVMIILMALIYNPSIPLPYKEFRQLSTTTYFVHKDIILLLVLLNVNRPLRLVLALFISIIIYFCTRKNKNKFVRMIFC